jgi:hypothetical protein
VPTQKYYFCPQCHERADFPRLFDALRDFSNTTPLCKCGAANELHVVLDFGLEARPAHCKVLHAFLPRPLVDWPKGDGTNVTFYPFLVILQRIGDEKHSTWLPYWHIEEKAGMIRRKYGQWAPFMDDPQFEDLVAQARKTDLFQCL